MVHVEIPQRRPWIGIGVLAAVALGVLVAVVNIYAGLLLITLAAGGATLALPGVRAMLIPASAGQRAAEVVTWPAVEQRTICTAEGDSRAAIVVPATSAEGYHTVWTSEGYVLADDAGKIVYALKR
jgi:hypothetical protein